MLFGRGTDRLADLAGLGCHTVERYACLTRVLLEARQHALRVRLEPRVGARCRSVERRAARSRRCRVRLDDETGDGRAQLAREIDARGKGPFVERSAVDGYQDALDHRAVPGLRTATTFTL